LFFLLTPTKSSEPKSVCHLTDGLRAKLSSSADELSLSGDMKKFIIVLITLYALPTFVLADSTNVVNNVTTSVSTGGNTSDGVVTEGQSKGSVKIYTEVNGEVVEDFQKEVSGEKQINYEVSNEFEGGRVETKVEVNGNVSKAPFDTLQMFIKYVKYVFSFFKF